MNISGIAMRAQVVPGKGNAGRFPHVTAPAVIIYLYSTPLSKLSRPSYAAAQLRIANASTRRRAGRFGAAHIQYVPPGREIGANGPAAPRKLRLVMTT